MNIVRTIYLYREPFRFPTARSLISTSSAPPTSGRESVAEFEDNLDEPSNKIPILPSVNGVPHGSVSIHVLLSCTSSNEVISSDHALSHLVIAKFRRAPVVPGVTGVKHG